MPDTTPSSPPRRSLRSTLGSPLALLVTLALIAPATATARGGSHPHAAQHHRHAVTHAAKGVPRPATRRLAVKLAKTASPAAKRLVSKQPAAPSAPPAP
ncbi:MAG TPA: hypothetical protein VII03_04250, partial [Solirubrobacteraceae bacterium]